MQRLLVLMYHRVCDPARPDLLENFTAHLRAIAERYPVVLPGQPLPSGAPLSVCLTFDDAYYDFYRYAFPLLKGLNIKAVLGVPVKYILDDTRVDPQERLAVPYPQGMTAPLYEEKAPLCTWSELKTMADSGIVKMASHTYSHPHLADAGVDLALELAHSKEQLEDNLQTEVDTLIYPFGNMSSDVHSKTRKLYRFAMRIGSALNRGWGGDTGLLYRVDAEHYWPENKPLTPKALRGYQRRYWWNRLRGK